ncbi:MAG: hypothetical protein IJ723_03465 [Ruminococcus sp.]|nr:hypothetical protein [Ruminococcus sp.]
MRHRLICCAAAAILLLTGCGREKKASLNFEKRLQAAALSANYRDTESYLSCWLPQEKTRYQSLPGYDSEFLDRMFADTDITGRLVFKLTDSTELNEAQIEKLEEDMRQIYGTRIDFTKALRADVEIRLNSSKEVLTDAREIILVRYENGWYIYGSVIDSYSFAGS